MEAQQLKSDVTVLYPDNEQNKSTASIEVLVLSQDQDFCHSVTEACGKDHMVHHVPELSEAVDVIGMGRAGVLVTDAAVSASEVLKITSRLHEVMPELVVVVAGRKDDGDELMELIDAGMVYRFLLKPVSAGRIKLAVEASANKYLENKTSPSVVQDNKLETATEEKAGSKKPPTLVIATVAVVVAVAVGIFIFVGGESKEQQTVAVKPSIQQITVEETAVITDPEPTLTAEEVSQFEGLRSDALVALELGRVAMPEGDNALSLFAAALEMNPDAEGLVGEFGRAISQAIALIESALTDGDLEKAQSLLNRLKEVTPDEARLPFMERQLKKEQLSASLNKVEAVFSEGDQDRAFEMLAEIEQTASANHPEVVAVREALKAAIETGEIEELIQSASGHIAKGELIAPAESNARYYYRAVLSRDENNTVALQGLQLIATSLLGDARAALDKEDTESATQYLLEAEASGAAKNEMKTLESRIEAVKKAKVERQQAAAASQEENSTEDAQQLQDQAADTGVPLVDLIQSDLVRTNYVAPKFPRNALRSGRSGWVDLSFIIGTDGSVKKIEIINSTPGTLFVEPARKAISQWKYQPILKEGKAVEGQVKFRLTFALQ